MFGNKARQMWLVNVITFILFVILTLTGLTNWLLLPRGYGAAGIWASLRHFLHDIHTWAAVFFIIGMIVHWSLHWGYIQTHVERLRRK